MRPSAVASAIKKGSGSFVNAVASAGLMGYVTSSGGNLVTDSNRAIWCCRIKGTAATLAFTAATATNVYVGVDGGSPATVAVSGGSAQLFTGLSDTWHSVWVTPVNPGSTFTLSGSVAAALTISGSATEFKQVSATYTLGGSSAGNFCTATSAYAGTPALQVLTVDQNAAGSNVPSIRARVTVGDNAGVFVLASTRYFYVAIDGITTLHDLGFIPSLCVAKYIALSAGTHDVNVWGHLYYTFPSTLGIGAVGSLVTVSPNKRMLQFGDSITEGNDQKIPSTNTYDWGCIDIFQVAAQMGYCGGTSGVSGNTCATLNTRLSAALAGYSGITSNDVAVIHIGVNDQPGGWGSTQQTAYTSIVNALLTKGFGRVLCRHPLPLTSNNSSYDGVRTGISTTVSAINDSRVKLVTTSSWPACANLHPTPAEYTAIVSSAVAAYGTAIA